MFTTLFFTPCSNKGAMVARIDVGKAKIVVEVKTGSKQAVTRELRKIILSKSGRERVQINEVQYDLKLISAEHLSGTGAVVHCIGYPKCPVVGTIEGFVTTQGDEIGFLTAAHSLVCKTCEEKFRSGDGIGVYAAYCSREPRLVSNKIVVNEEVNCALVILSGGDNDRKEIDTWLKNKQEAKVKHKTSETEVKTRIISEDPTDSLSDMRDYVHSVKDVFRVNGETDLSFSENDESPVTGATAVNEPVVACGLAYAHGIVNAESIAVTLAVKKECVFREFRKNGYTLELLTRKLFDETGYVICHSLSKNVSMLNKFIIRIYIECKVVVVT